MAKYGDAIRQLLGMYLAIVSHCILDDCLISYTYVRQSVSCLFFSSHTLLPIRLYQPSALLLFFGQIQLITKPALTVIRGPTA